MVDDVMVFPLMFHTMVAPSRRLVEEMLENNFKFIYYNIIKFKTASSFRFELFGAAGCLENWSHTRAGRESSVNARRHVPTTQTLISLVTILYS